MTYARHLQGVIKVVDKVASRYMYPVGQDGVMFIFLRLLQNMFKLEFSDETLDRLHIHHSLVAAVR